MQTFEEYSIKALKLKNKIVMPPMCMYSADSSGLATDFHFSHYTARAIGGVGSIIEATDVTPNGRLNNSIEISIVIK